MADVPDYPKLRDDVTFSRVVLRGEETFIAKDPVRRKYMQFDRLGMRICELCNGRNSLEDLVRLISRDFPDWDFDLDYVTQYVEHLIKMRLIFRDRIEYNVLMMEKVRREREKHNTLLHMTFPAADPHNFFTWLMARLRWVAAKPFVLFYWIFVIGSYAVLVGNLEESWTALSSFYVFTGWSLGQIVGLYLVIILIMVIHEFGHGMTCVYYGGEVHQMGFLLIYLINPALYCNVSDSYRFPRKLHRLMVVYGGPLVEMFIGAIFVYLWWLSDPKLHIHDFAFKIVIFSSISAWIFNMNPLLKYDGYYILSEMVDIPNLRKRAFGYLGWLWKSLFKLPAEKPPGGRREQRIYLIYSIAAFVYSIMIFSIIYGLLKRWFVGGLAAFGWILLAATMYLILRRPLGKGVDFVKLAAMDRSGFIRRNVPVVVTIIALLLLVPAVIYTPTVDKRLAILEPYYQINIEAVASGFVRELGVETGDEIRPGQFLARVESTGLERELIGVRHEIDRTRVLAGEASARGDASAAAGYRDHLARLTESEALVRQRSGGLVIRSPLQGQVLSPHTAELLHRFVREGEMLMQIGRTDSLRVRLEIPERNMAEVELGSLVKFKPASQPRAVVRGRVVVIDLVGEAAVDEEAYYGVEIVMDNTGLGLVPGQRGRVRLYGRRRSLWGQLLHSAIQTLRLDFFI